MNLLLLTQEEAALAGRPVNQPRMDTDRHGLDGEKVGRWEEEKRSEGGTNPNGGRSRDAFARPALTLDPSPPGEGRLHGEEEFLRLLFEFTHSVQLNPDRTIALAAKRWERSLRFRLAVTRQRRWQRHLPCSPAPVGIRSQEPGGGSRRARGATRSGSGVSGRCVGGQNSEAARWGKTTTEHTENTDGGDRSLVTSAATGDSCIDTSPTSPPAPLLRLTAERVAPGRGGEGLRGMWHGGYDIGRHSE